MTFLTNLGVTWIICTSKLVLEKKACKEILESSWLEFFIKFSGSIFTLSDGEDNTLPYAYCNGEECWVEIGWNRHSYLSLTKLTKNVFLLFKFHTSYANVLCPYYLFRKVFARKQIWKFFTRATKTHFKFSSRFLVLVKAILNRCCGLWKGLK